MFTSSLNNIAKRAFDISAALLGLIFLAPFFLFIAFRIKHESPGPIFYGGKRAGKNNRPFEIWKFRTMYEKPESYAGPAVTAHGDARITSLGHWLRDTKINELPQLWNVLLGEMSFVGPRPEDWDIVQKDWTEESRAEILSVRPGITSPASIIYRNEEKMLAGEDFMARYYQNILPDKMRLDRLYVRHHSMLGDIDVILWTLAALLPQIASARIAEGHLFGGPISRFVRFNLSWFATDFVIAFAAAGVVGVLWRTTGPIDVGLPNAFLFALGISLLFGTINTIFGLNSVAWSRAVPEDMIGIVASAGIVIALAAGVNHFLPLVDIPTPMLLMIGLIAIIGFVAVRYRWRLLSGFSLFWTSRRKSFSIGERVLIAGTGEESEYINWLLRRGDLRFAFSVIGVVDDNPLLQGMRLDGNWVIGTLADIPHLVKQHDVGLIIMALSAMTKTEHAEAMNTCIETGARLLLTSDMMGAMQNWLKKSSKATDRGEMKIENGS
jgi:lipopolysaccharide/colanic/teichoic acid biosynthesis glycosyltransferase